MMLADEIKMSRHRNHIERVLRMALVHDWAETRVGDMPKTATDYFGAEARKRAEESAFAISSQHRDARLNTSCLPRL